MKSSSAEAQLAAFLDKFTLEVAGMARAVLAKMRKRLPGATEMVYDNYNALAIGFGPTDRASEAVFSIVLYPRWVTFFFLQGATLSDPAKILKGSGKVVRHFVLKDPSDLDKPEIQALIAQELKRSPIDPAAKRRLIIKSIAEKQRPRRAVSVKARKR
jgi:hypothetical protein